MLVRLNKLAYSPCSRAMIQNYAYLSCKPIATVCQSRCHSNQFKVCDVQRSTVSVYRTTMSSQPPENHRQFSVMLAPKQAPHLYSSNHILSREINPSPWCISGVGLGLRSSRGLSTLSIVNGYYYVLGNLIDSLPVETARYLFTCFHDAMGVPWWCVIIAGTVCFRLALVPLHILSLKSQGRLLTIREEIKTKSTHIAGGISAAAVLYKQTPYTMKRETRLEIKQMKKELYEKHNCAPLKPLFVMYVSTSVNLVCGFGLRSMTGRLGPIDHYFRPEIAEEGLFWFKNLTIADPYCILPTLGIICAISGLEYGMLLRKVNHDQLNWGVTVSPKTKPQKFLNFITRLGQGFFLCSFPFLCFASSGITLCFCTMTSWSLVQLLTLHSPAVKKALSIPMTQQCSPTPHKDVLNAFKEKYLLRKKATPTSKMKPK